MQISNAVGVKALQSANRIRSAFSGEPKASVECSAERGAAQDLARLRLVVGAWASRNEVDEVTFARAQETMARWLS